MESVRIAKEKKLALVAGFCWRYNYGERALFQRVHDGEIGELRALETVYNTGLIWVHPRTPGQTDMEYQLRNWYYFTWLSGDHIVEQAVHSIDKMAWAMKDEPPVSCVAVGGRQVRTEEKYGHIYDHFGVTYNYANGVRGYHMCRQFTPGTANANSDYFAGSKGYASIKAFGPLEITGDNPWKFSGERPNMYQVEHNELFASIRKGEPINDGDRMAKSTLLAIMGRMAAYTGQVIKWEDALNSQESLAPASLEDWQGQIPVPPVAMPGQTKFA
jgi:myo-inositol 2-dehydrogenase / D-chiro-inositol 1-dehydrogenase